MVVKIYFPYRRAEPVLPTHAHTPDITPSRPSDITPSRPSYITPSRPILPSTTPHRYPLSPITPCGPALPVYSLSPTDSPTLHLKYGNIPKREVIKLERGIPTLDLHGMTVKEATRATDLFIRQSLGHYPRVNIVTGRGLHTVGGVPKVKPAITTYLANCRYKYREVHNGGCLEVILG